MWSYSAEVNDQISQQYIMDVIQHVLMNSSHLVSVAANYRHYVIEDAKILTGSTYNIYFTVSSKYLSLPLHKFRIHLMW